MSCGHVGKHNPHAGPDAANHRHSEPRAPVPNSNTT